jgi:glutathione S-transferase
MTHPNDADGILLKFFTLEGRMCPFGARTWITLLELGLPFELVEIDAKAKTGWYLDINPRGKVPAIQNTRDGTIVYESAICNEYLSDYARQVDESKPTDGAEVWHMTPIDAADRAAMRLLNDHVDTSVGPAMFNFMVNHDPEQDSQLKDKVEDALVVLQAALSTRGGPFLMGKNFTLADAHALPFFLRLVVTLRHFKNYEVPPERFALLFQWYELCSHRESVAMASKSDEEIIEAYQRFVDMKRGFSGLNKNK